MVKSGNGSPACADAVPQEIMACFWELAEIDQNKRIKAVEDLIKGLKQHNSVVCVGSEDASQDPNRNTSESIVDEALRDVSPCAQYVVKRLCRGVCSGRLAARQGFALGLAAVLSDLDHCSDDIVAGLLRYFETLSASGDRDDFLGHIFGLAAIIRSRVGLNLSNAVDLIDSMIGLAERKIFLREAVSVLIMDFLDANIALVKHVLDRSTKLQKWLHLPVEKSFPEALTVAIFLWPYMPSSIRENCSLIPISGIDVASSSGAVNGLHNMKDQNELTDILFTKENVKKMSMLFRTVSDCHPRIHTVWNSLLEVLYTSLPAGENKKSRDRAKVSAEHLEVFWKNIVEDDIFRSRSQKRRYLGFKLFIMLSERLPPSAVPLLLTSNFLTCLSNNVSRSDQMLYNVAIEAVHALAKSIANADAGLSQNMFNQIRSLGGKNLSKLLKAVAPNGDGVSLATEELESEEQALHLTQDIIENLAKEISNPSSDPTSKEQLRLLSDQLVTKVKRHNSSYEIVEKSLRCLIKCALQTNKGIGNEADDEDVTIAIRITFANQLLAALGAASKGEERDWADWVANSAIQCLKSEQQGILIDENLEETLSSFDQARGTIHKALESKNEEKTEASHARISKLRNLLHLVSILEVYAVLKTTENDFVVAEDLNHLVERYIDTNAAASDSDQDWADVLMDIILSTLSRNEAPLASFVLRHAAEKTFKAFVSDFNRTGLQDMLQVVMQPLGQQSAKDSEEDEASNASDVDDLEEQDESEQASDAGDQQEEETSELSDGDENNINCAESPESSSIDEEEDDVGTGSDKELMEDAEEGYDDEQMFKFDERFSAIVGAIKSKKDTKQMRLDLLNFKMRVVTCIKIFMKHARTNPALLSFPSVLLAALLDATGAHGDQTLAENIASLLTSDLEKCKVQLVDENDVEELSTQLRRSLYLASRGVSKIIQRSARAAYLFLLRAAFASPCKDVTEQGKHSLLAAIADFFTKKKTKLNRNLFVEIFRRVPRTAIVAFPKLLCCTDAARTEYLRQEGYALIELSSKACETGIIDLLKAEEVKMLLSKILVGAVSGKWSKIQRETAATKQILNTLLFIQTQGLDLSTVLIRDCVSQALECLEANKVKTTQSPHSSKLLDILLPLVQRADNPANKKRKTPKRQNVDDCTASAGKKSRKSGKA